MREAGTENAPELAAEADRAMKSARSLTARHIGVYDLGCDYGLSFSGDLEYYEALGLGLGCIWWGGGLVWL